MRENTILVIMLGIGALMFIGLIALIPYAQNDLARRRAICEAAGGVYLMYDRNSHECVDFKSMKHYSVH